jgi:hypothetical protein
MHHTNNISHADVVLQKFYMMIFVVKTVPVADLVKKLEAGNRISKDNIIRESKCNGLQL